MFIEALFTIPKIWKKSKCPSRDKEDVLYIYREKEIVYVITYMWGLKDK